jgi:Flp pilus assembly protein CpaB
MALASAHSLPTPPIPKSLAAPRFNPRLAVGLLVLTSAILGLVAAYRSAQPRTVEVLRAAHDVQPGYVLQSADVQVVAEALPDDVAASLASASERPSLVGRRLAQPLNAGDLITHRQTEPATRQLGPGERLYALQIPNETALGLHLQPADEVEIVVTTNKTRPEVAETHVVLPAVSIFSIGGSESSGAFGVSTNADHSGLGTSKTTTLVLRTDDAGYQALARAREIGDLDLSLLGGSQEPAP